MKFIWQGTFWEGFLYPFALFFVGTLIITPLYILSKKAPKVGAVVAEILLWGCMLFLGGLVLLIVVLLLNSVFHFLF